MLRKFVLLLGIGFTVLATSAIAAPCAGFPDVDDAVVGTDFCQSVEWIKNRGVTLGCMGGTAYCPSDGVSRLQMAAFMRRLGRALTPFVLADTRILQPLSLVAGAYVCITPTLPATLYPRFGVISATMSFGLTESGPLVADPVYSLDGGLTWILANPFSHLWMINHVGLGNGAAESGAFTIPPGSTVTAALYIARYGLSISNLDLGQCLVRATINTEYAP